MGKRITHSCLLLIIFMFRKLFLYGYPGYMVWLGYFKTWWMELLPLFYPWVDISNTDSMNCLHGCCWDHFQQPEGWPYGEEGVWVPETHHKLSSSVPRSHNRECRERQCWALLFSPSTLSLPGGWPQAYLLLASQTFLQSTNFLIPFFLCGSHYPIAWLLHKY